MVIAENDANSRFAFQLVPDHQPPRGPTRATSAVASIVGQPERMFWPIPKDYGTLIMSLARRCWGVMAATWLGVNVGGKKSLGLT